MKNLLLLFISLLLFSCSTDEDKYDNKALEKSLYGTWQLIAYKPSGIYGERCSIDGDITWTFKPDGSFEGKGSGKLTEGISKGYDMSFMNYSGTKSYKVGQIDYNYGYIDFTQPNQLPRSHDVQVDGSEMNIYSSGISGNITYYFVKK